MLEAVNARLAALDGKQSIPVDLVTASGSGLDPHISLEAALYQLERVSRARGKKEEDIRALVEKYTQKNILSGQAYVNVLLLNLALDGK